MKVFAQDNRPPPVILHVFDVTSPPFFISPPPRANSTNPHAHTRARVRAKSVCREVGFRQVGRYREQEHASYYYYYYVV